MNLKMVKSKDLLWRNVMGYNVIDLINRCIQIEDIKLKYLEELIEKKKNEPTVQIMCKVFLKDSISSRSFYKNLKETLLVYF